MNNLLAATLNDNLAEIVGKLQSLMDSFWIYIVMALAAVVVIWGAYVGIKIAIAHKNEEKINARDMVKNLIIGIIIIFVAASYQRSFRLGNCVKRRLSGLGFVRLTQTFRLHTPMYAPSRPCAPSLPDSRNTSVL